MNRVSEAVNLEDVQQDMENLATLIGSVARLLPGWDLDIDERGLVLSKRVFPDSNAWAEYWAKSEYRIEDGRRVRVVRG